MFNLKNITALKGLMIISELLIVAFVVQWLFSQYSSEKDLLRKNLFQQFTKSKEQLTDSMIVLNLIDPILKDNKGFKVHAEVNDEDSSSGKKTGRGNKVERFVVEHGTKTTLLTDDILPAEPDSMPRLHHTSDSTKAFLVHGVKMIIYRVKASSGGKGSMEETFFTKTDTGLLKKLFSENLEKNGLKLNAQWVSGVDSSLPLKNKSIIYFESNSLPASFGVEFNHYHFYLIKRLIPQFLFALILLLLTSAAFIISFKSVKNQMQLGQLKNNFISNISHELKTPVSTVKVAIEALQNFDLKNNAEKAEEYLDMASVEMNRLDLLISQVLTDSMLEDGAFQLSLEVTNLSDIIDETLNSFRLRFKQQNAIVKFEKPMEELRVKIDRLHVQGVFMNLLDNSLKYSEGNPEISIVIRKAGDRIILSVSDKGPGIPIEYINKVFEKFFRVPSGDKHNVKGYGLGLSYAVLIMKQHGGAIDVESNPGSGCNFILTFHLA